MGALIRVYQTRCAEVIKRWDGHIAKYMGDGVLAYFGYPRAHEDDGERAVRAGLELVEAIADIKAVDHPLAARVGIATGLVVVGELIGEGAAQEQTVVGETPNLAARLEALAPPGGVVIAPATRSLLGDLFQLENLGAHTLKGFAIPVEAARVVRARATGSRFEAVRGAQLGPLVGREHELGLLLDRWRRAHDGEGHVVLLAGEAGIGKSRLLHALRERLGDETYTALPHDGSPFHTNSALFPVIGLLERAAGFGLDDSPAGKLAKLETLLKKGTDDLATAVPLVAALLGIETGESYPKLDIDPQRQKQRTLQVLVEQVAGLTARAPVLVLFEDAHWFDPTSLELLDLLVEQVRSLPSLVLITHRPDFTPPWIGRARVTQLPLSHLSQHEGAAIVARVTGGRDLPREVLEEIIARTEGVPLFVEELTKTVIESDLLTATGNQYVLDGPLPPLAIPTTLHDSLMARLDRLAPVKDIAEIGAAIGREFSHALLAAVAERDEPQLNAALDQLVQAELIFRRGIPPEATYSFKHALVQDAAYQSLLKSKRQQLHARIAAVLEQSFQTIVDKEPETLAHHHTEACCTGAAIRYWYRAGVAFAARQAHGEAIAHLKRGLALVEKLPRSDSQQSRELDHLSLLGELLMAVRGLHSHEAAEVFSRAKTLCRSVQDPRRTAEVSLGLGIHHHANGNLLEAQGFFEEGYAEAQRSGDPGIILPLRQSLAVNSYFRGDFVVAEGTLQRTIELADSHKEIQMASMMVWTPRINCRSFLGLTKWLLGFPEQAALYSEQAVSMAEELKSPYVLAYSLVTAAILAFCARDHRRVQQLASRASDIAQEYRLQQWLQISSVLRVWARSFQLCEDEQASDIEEALDNVRLVASKVVLMFALLLLGDVYVRLGRPKNATAVLKEALSDMRRSGDRRHEAEVLRLLGEAFAAAHANSEAEKSFQQALAVARTQAAKSWELRAATSLARLKVNCGQRQIAHDILAPIYSWFTEGFDTADLKDAKVLLDELA